MRDVVGGASFASGERAAGPGCSSCRAAPGVEALLPWRARAPFPPSTPPPPTQTHTCSTLDWERVYRMWRWLSTTMSTRAVFEGVGTGQAVSKRGHYAPAGATSSCCGATNQPQHPHRRHMHHTPHATTHLTGRQRGRRGGRRAAAGAGHPCGTPSGTACCASCRSRCTATRTGGRLRHTRGAAVASHKAPGKQACSATCSSLQGA